MKRRFLPVFLVAAAFMIAWPAASTATAPNNEANSYMFLRGRAELGAGQRR